MVMAFIMSLWFIHSFKKGLAPKILSVIILVAVAIFCITASKPMPDKLAKSTHYKSYISQVIFYSRNFKWILLATILVIMACFTSFLSTLNARRASSWFKRLQLVSSAAFSVGHGGNDAQKVMGIITAALMAHGTISDFHSMPIWCHWPVIRPLRREL
jgi:PiT family inorganic phosphate transporter